MTICSLDVLLFLFWTSPLFHVCSRGSSQPGDWTQVSCSSGSFFTIWATRETQRMSGASNWSCKGMLSLFAFNFLFWKSMENWITIEQFSAKSSSSGITNCYHVTISALCVCVCTHTFCLCMYMSTWRRKWHPTPVFLPRESCGQRSLVGCCP